MVTPEQLSEHIKGDAIPSVLNTNWDVMIIRGASLRAPYVRFDRVPGGFEVRHGKYRELKQAHPAMPQIRMPR